MEGGERVDHGGGSHRQRCRRPEGLRRLWGEYVDDDNVDDGVDDGVDDEDVGESVLWLLD